MNTFGFYCNWSVIVDNHGFWVSPIHSRYIDQLLQRGFSVVLLSSTATGSKDGFIFYSYTNVKLIALPEFTSYLGALKHSIRIMHGVKELVDQCDCIYIRLFEPFAWYFSFIHKAQQKIFYHIISNPISAILNKKNDSSIIRLLKVSLFYPEYLFTLFRAQSHGLTCNGPSCLDELPKFTQKHVTPIIESSLIQSDFYQSDILNDDTITFLTVCDLRPAKGVDDLIHAFSKLDKKNLSKAKLIIVGDGAYRLHLEALTKSLNLDSNVEFMGFIPLGTELFHQYKSADIFVMPSLSETGPRVLLEAMASGLFCISTNVGYVNVIIDADSGIIVEPGNIEQLFKAINSVFINREKCKYSANKSFSNSQNYTLTRFFDSLLKGD